MPKRRRRRWQNILNFGFFYFVLFRDENNIIKKWGTEYIKKASTKATKYIFEWWKNFRFYFFCFFSAIKSKQPRQEFESVELLPCLLGKICLWGKHCWILALDGGTWRDSNSLLSFQSKINSTLTLFMRINLEVKKISLAMKSRARKRSTNTVGSMYREKGERGNGGGGD